MAKIFTTFQDLKDQTIISPIQTAAARGPNPDPVLALAKNEPKFGGTEKPVFSNNDEKIAKPNKNWGFNSFDNINIV